MKRLPFLILAVTFTLASCTIQKRIYRPGYTVEWHNTKQSTGEEQLADNNAAKDVQSLVSEQLPSANSTLDSPQQEDNATTIAPSANPSPAQAREITSFSKKETTAKAQAKPALITQKQLKASMKKIKKTNSSDDDDNSEGGRGLNALGWIFISIGLGVLLFSNTPVGVTLMLLGLLFIIIGVSKKSKTPDSSTNKKDKTNYIDVVYLKNSSIIRGMIIEMVPNVSIKIQTRDGNVFFFKMEEVEKMTKEKAN